MYFSRLCWDFCPRIEPLCKTEMKMCVELVNFRVSRRYVFENAGRIRLADSYPFPVFIVSLAYLSSSATENAQA